MEESNILFWEEDEFCRLTINYTNYRGETSVREIYPQNIWWGKTKFHPEEQWLMTAWDVQKKDNRDFAIKDMKWVKRI